VLERIARLEAPGRRRSAFAPPRRGDYDLNDPSMRAPPPLKPAAVLVGLVDREPGMTLILTQRTAHLQDHAGQISFPGGRIDPEDATAEAAALREAREEIGLDAARISLLGRLDTYETRTGFEVVPVLGLVTPPFTVRPDPYEVADVFEVPLAFVLDPANHQRHSREFKGAERHFYALPFGDRYIWGATAGMLINLYEILRD
jgi:8-oxo-dGTP pyrophosphatase MutT (NUDIX family)